MEEFHVNFLNVRFKLVFPGEVEDTDDLDDVDDGEAGMAEEHDRGAGEVEGHDSEEKMTKHQS